MRKEPKRRRQAPRKPTPGTPIRKLVDYWEKQSGENQSLVGPEKPSQEDMELDNVGLEGTRRIGTDNYPQGNRMGGQDNKHGNQDKQYQVLAKTAEIILT